MNRCPIHTLRHGAVLEVVLDRPKANAIEASTSRLMGDIFARFRDDPELRVAIITGAGEKFFCAGWDLVAGAEGEPLDADYGVGGFGGIQELPDLTSRSLPRSMAWRSAAGSSLRSRPTSSSPPTMRASPCPRSRPARWPRQQRRG
ncbi:MAG: enoyl-CoA hydratase-related protein [Aliidongia sp.]